MYTEGKEQIEGESERVSIEGNRKDEGEGDRVYTEGKGQGEGEDLDTFICSKIRFFLNSRIPNVYSFLASVSPIICKFQNFRILEFWNRDTSQKLSLKPLITKLRFLSKERATARSLSQVMNYEA